MKNQKNANNFFNRFISAIILAIVLIGLFVPSVPVFAASSTVTHTGPVAIPDNSCAASQIIAVAIAPYSTIGDLNVVLDISHTVRSQVRATLTSPAGTSVVLITGAGLGSPTIASPDNFDHYDVLLDDTSIGSLYDNSDDTANDAGTDRTARPSNPLSAFKGENANGNWSLAICDTNTGTTGTYNNSSLVFTIADPNTIVGTVFTDYNDNGVRGQGDPGVSGIVVDAYNSTGTLVDTDTTTSTGGYSLSIPDGTAVRLEFSNIPANLRPGAYGTDSGTTVQFVTSPAVGIDMGLSQPEDYCNNNPLLVMPCYSNGDPLLGGTASTRPALYSIPYDAYGRKDTTTTQNTLAFGDDIGTTWGLAFQRTSDTVYAGALAKRHAGVGPLGTGGIYAITIDPLTGTAISVSNFIDLTTLGIPAGTLGTNAARGLPMAALTPSTDATAWDAVGKSAIGDLDMGSDDETLWMINLANQTLYSLYIGNPPTAPTVGDVTAYPITLPGGATACAATDIRPWAVEVYRGDVYVGVVCSAESTQNVSDLRAYILSMDETAPAGFSLVYEFALNYPRGVVSSSDGGYPAEWRPWSPTMTSICIDATAPNNVDCTGRTDLAFNKQIIYPQPILSDIEFDTDGDMIVGLMDRLGHQVGNANYATTNPWGTVNLSRYDTGTFTYTTDSVTFATAGETYEGVAAGDILRICRVAGVFALESNATCGGITTGGAGSAPAQGPGGGEYYWQDMFSASTGINSGTHHEVTLGGLVLFPGTDEIAVSTFDPFAITSGGISWFSNSTGLRTRAYEIFTQDEGGVPTTFGKAAGIGDIEGFCYNAPIEIGNRIWNDTDGDGIQDAGESPIAGVTVELYEGATLIDSVVTDANGNYFFSSGPGTASASHAYLLDDLEPITTYEIRIPNAQGGSQQAALAGFTLSPIDADLDQRDSDGSYTGNNAIKSITTGDAGDNDHTFDFGFTTGYSLGNRVWFDTDNSSTLNGSEVGIDGVDVQLYAADGSGNPTGAVLQTDTTSSGGYYRFDGLATGDYVVVIPASEFDSGGTLIGYLSSGTTMSTAGVISETIAPDPDTTATDNDDNGTKQTVAGPFIGTVISAAITLGPGAGTEPTTDNDPVTNPETGEAPNGQSNRTVDFGFYYVEIGDIVFVDVNPNGTYGGTDTLLLGATVQLYASDGSVDTEINVGPDGILGTIDDAAGGVTTLASGAYLFSGLPAGNYVVKVTPPSGYGSTIDTADSVDTTDPDTNTNNNDNGVGTASGQVSSGLLTMTPGETGTNITTNNATGITSDPSVDFGFVTVVYSLGNRVWFDTDNSSTLNGSEAGINGVDVELYAADGSGNPTGLVLDTETTSGGGYYRFDNLAPGDYVVVIPASEFGSGGTLVGYLSSGTSINGVGVVSETAAPDPDTTVTDNDDNGTKQTSGTFDDAVISAAVTLGPGTGTEPITDNDPVTNPETGEAPNGQSNRTVDFGFYRLQIGNLIYEDTVVDGTYTGADSLLSGATVQLYASNGTTEINVGPDGILGTTDDATGGVTTGAGGTYLFSGLPAGDYVVKVTPPSGSYTSTIDTADSTDTTDPDTNTNDNDNGAGTASGQVSSGVVTLTPGQGTGGTAGAANNVVTNSSGSTYDPTLDFGFVNITLYSLGNRVWFDTDNSATLNGSEAGINGVDVQLYAADGSGNPTGAVLDTETTSGGGYYRFDGLATGDYVVVIPASEFGTGGTLIGYWSSNTTISTAGVISETSAPDPDTTATDNDDNGTKQTSGTFDDAVISAAVTLGPGTGTEPTTDNDPVTNPETGEAPNGQSNRTVDFGFYRLQIGNLIYEDTVVDGTYTGADSLLSGATVQLYASDGTTEINVGPDGILGTIDDATGGVTTGAGGTYLFSGLPAGDYVVKVTPPSGSYTSTIDTADSTDTTDPDTNTDNNDNGAGTASGQVSSGVLTMTPGETGTNITITDATGTTSDPSMDFGFVTIIYSLGNRVWFDTDNSATLNGSEVGIDGVDVELYAADGSGNPTGLALDTETTSGGGYYRFDGLATGDYVVVIPASEFGSGGTLIGYWSSSTSMSTAGVVSETSAPDPDTTATDNDDNGTKQTSGTFDDAVISAAVTLGPGTGTEPTTDNDPVTNPETGEAPNGQSNRTVDFGFYRLQISNFVFVDVDTNGTYAGSDTLLSGATVQLYASDGSTDTEVNVGPDGILNTADDAAGGVTTGAGGTYLFSGLPAGNYVVKVTPPNTYSSTIDTADSADTTDPDTNTDDNDNGIGTTTGQVSSGLITMTPGETGTNITTNNATGTTLDPSVDFGFATLMYSLGNRVWFDTDNSATLNGSEVGISGVNVQLYAANGSGNPTGSVLQTETTDASGYYRFDNLVAGDYIVIIPADNFRDIGVGDTVVGDPLQNYWSSSTSINASGAISDSTLNDPDTDTDDNDDNGITTFASGNVDYVSSAAITLGPGSASEPTTDNDPVTNPESGEAPNGQSNRTVDFGFYYVEIGDLVFVDVNTNGTYGGSDTLLSGATVQIYASNNTTEINVGPDGILGTTDDAAGGVTTGAGGTYSFSGLPAGDYIIRVTPPSGFVSTIDTADSTDTTDPDTNTNNNDNGVGTASGQVSSGVLTMTAGETGTNITNIDATGTTNDSSVDFGFTVVYSLGNLVWFDTDNSATLNGLEVGIDGVDVELYAADGSGNPTGAALDTETTSGGGYYRFDNLSAGDYVVVIPASEFGSGGTLISYLSSGTSINGVGIVSETSAPDPDTTATDNDDNGTKQTSGTFDDAVISVAVTLGPGTDTEPTTDNDPVTNPETGEAPNGQSNRTVDFGFYRVELSNQIFVDVNEDGLYNAGDLVLPGATVQLYASDGTTEINVGPDGILGTTDDATGGVVTGGGGVYLFSGLPEGTYIVGVTPPTGASSTIDTGASSDTADPNVNTNNNDNGVGTSTGQVFSNDVTLTPGSLSVNNVVDDATGTTTDPTLDFGFRTSFTKAFISSDATHTTDPFITIGEIATYEITMYVPVGTLNNVQLVDTPQSGLAFVDCISIILPANVTSSTTASGDCDANDGTDNTPPGISNPLIENSGGRATFDFGTVTNSTATPQIITIRYSLIVLDIIANQTGDTLTNSVVWSWTGGSRTTSAPPVEIVQPQMTIDKSATPTSADYGSIITFTIDIEHDVISTADAFDVEVTDQIPAGLAFVTGSITSSGTATLTSSNYNTGTSTLTFIWDVFRLGETASVTFQATFIGPAPVVNSANVEWTSLLIDPQLNNTPPTPDVPVQLSPYNPDGTERWYDPLNSAGVNNYGVNDSVPITLPGVVDPSLLPRTGFEPGVVTDLPRMPEEMKYATTDVWIEIPRLKLKLDIVGVPFDNKEKEWDLTWLGDSAGWLDGTAFPTYDGNSALTAHSTLSNGKPGPFADLATLKYGDQIIIHLGGQKYIYEIRENTRVRPSSVTSVLKHEELSWLTLITCKSYNEATGEYVYRSVVRAVLVKVIDE